MPRKKTTTTTLLLGALFFGVNFVLHYRHLPYLQAWVAIDRDNSSSIPQQNTSPTAAAASPLSVSMFYNLYLPTANRTDKPETRWKTP